MIKKTAEALKYVAGYTSCVALMTGIAFGFGYITHTGIFA